MRITGYNHKADFERLMVINDAGYSGEYRPPQETVSSMISVSDVFVARVDHDLIAGIEGKIVGFAIIKNTDQPYLWNLAVDPAYQGRGVGGNILREIIKRYTLAKSSDITLHVNTQNPAQKLYFDYGFRVISFVKDYFKPDDGLYMQRRLP